MLRQLVGTELMDRYTRSSNNTNWVYEGLLFLFDVQQKPVGENSFWFCHTSIVKWNRRFNGLHFEKLGEKSDLTADGL
jgi:hypothetical protein